LRSPESVRYWVTKIAVNEAKGHLARCINAQRTLRPIEGEDGYVLREPAIEPEQRVVEAAIDAGKLLRLARTISPVFAVILYLYDFEDLEFQFIADMLVMPLATTRTIYYRNKKKLQDQLGVPRKAGETPSLSVKNPKLPESQSLDEQSGRQESLTL